MIIYGHRRFGTVTTPAGQVATMFFHLYFFPLFPTGGVHLKGERTLPAPLNRLSVAVAYARTWGLLATVGLLVLTSDAIESSLASGAAWLVPTLAVALATAASWFVVGARETTRRRLALGLGLPALAVLLALAPAYRENRHRQQTADGTELDAALANLPPGIAQKLKTLSPDEQRKALTRLARDTKVDTQRWEPDWSTCKLRKDGPTCMKVGKAASLAGDTVYAQAGYEQACHSSVAEGCVLFGQLVRSEQTADWAFLRACELGSGAGCAASAQRVKSPNEAAKLSEKACKLDSADGCRSFGEALRSGSGVKKNTARAKTTLKKACALGDQAACSG